MAPASDIFAPDLLRDRVALVTGGGTNLGREAARELLACGADVVIAGRREAVLAEAGAELGGRGSYGVGGIRGRDQAHGVAAAAPGPHRRGGRVVHNARGEVLPA